MTIADDVLLPEGTRLLHIGPHKTGTTTLQGAFHAARLEVARQGVHYASPNRQAKQAARAVGGHGSPYADGQVPSESHWTNLVREVRRSRAKRILISAEGFADAGQDAARRMVSDLDRTATHVVATLRPLARILPSQWQQQVQNGLQLGYEAWLEAILRRPDEGPGKLVWRRHRHDRLVRRWIDLVGADRVTIVVVDDADHLASLRTFERLLGLRAGTLAPDATIYNRSLTRPEAELIRAMHRATTELGVDKGLRLNLVLHGAAANLKFRATGPDEPRIETPAWAQQEVAGIAREIVDGIRTLGVRVLGNLETLVEAPRAARREDDVATQEAWPAVNGRALLGVLIETGLTRGAAGRAGSDWPDAGLPADDAGDRSGKPKAVSALPALPDLPAWSTSRLSSLVAGRVRSGARVRLAGPLRAVPRALRQVLGRAGRRAGGASRDARGGARGGRRRDAAEGRARGASIDLTTPAVTSNDRTPGMEGKGAE